MTSGDIMTFDATPVRSLAFRRQVERALSDLSLQKADGLRESVRAGRDGASSQPRLVVGDLAEVTSDPDWRTRTVGQPSLFLVLLVRTAADEGRLSSPAIALQLAGERVFLLDLKRGQARSELSEQLRDYVAALVDRLRPGRVLSARFSQADEILWVEFGDGVERAIGWRGLQFARELKIKPVSATASASAQAVTLRDPSGRTIDIDAGALRATLDRTYRRRVQRQDAEDRRAVGVAIRAVREGAGLSQEELSRRSGVPQESLSRIETGRRDPRLDTLRKLATGFGLSLPELMDRLAQQE
jgi:ribosome-binding protein aMBF1 (putative translation factor)